MSEIVDVISEEQAKLNREDFKRRMKAEGKLDNPYENKPQERHEEFHGFQ